MSITSVHWMPNCSAWLTKFLGEDWFNVEESGEKLTPTNNEVGKLEVSGNIFQVYFLYWIPACAGMTNKKIPCESVSKKISAFQKVYRRLSHRCRNVSRILCVNVRPRRWVEVLNSRCPAVSRSALRDLQNSLPKIPTIKPNREFFIPFTFAPPV